MMSEFYLSELEVPDPHTRRRMAAELERLEHYVLLARNYGDTVREAETLDDLGSAFAASGQWELATTAHNQALYLFRSLADPAKEALATYHLAQDYEHLDESGKFWQMREKALEYYQKAQNLCLQEKLPLLLDVSLAFARNVVFLSRDTPKILQNYKEFLRDLMEMSRDRKDWRLEYEALVITGRAYFELNLASAQGYLADARQLSRLQKDQARYAIVLFHFGEYYFLQNQARKAIESCTEALQIFQQIGYRKGETYSLNRLGLIYYMAAGDAITAQVELPDGVPHLQTSLAYLEQALEKAESPAEKINILYALYDTYARAGDETRLHSCVEEKIQIYETLSAEINPIMAQAFGHGLLSTHPHLVTNSMVSVMNINFADRHDQHILARREYLQPGKEYDLVVDIMQYGNFDQQPSQAQPGWLEAEVTFVSEEFATEFTRSPMRIQTLDAEAGKTTPIKIPIQTPDVAGKAAIRAHGRVCLYAGAQVLQSSVIDMGISQSQMYAREKTNEYHPDYLLAPSFETVNQDLLVRRHMGKKGRQPDMPVRASIMMNADLSGTHRLLLKTDSNDKKNGLPAAWKSYSETAINESLSKIRQTLGNPSGKKLEDYESNTFVLDKFKDDLIALAKLGYRLYIELLQGIKEEVAPGAERNPGIWQQKFTKMLKSGDIIQIARAGSVPHTHTIPWALIYDYPIREPLKICRFVEEQWEQKDVYVLRSRSNKQEILQHCPYEAEHTENTICPFGFWGYKYIIEHPLSGVDDVGWDIKPARCIKVESEIEMMVASTTTVRHPEVRKNHFTTIQRFAKANYHPTPPAITRDEVRDNLSAPHLVYWLGYGEKDGDLTALKIGPRDADPNHALTPDLPTYWNRTGQYINGKKWEKIRPLIFINGCHTADVLPKLTLTFVSAFHDIMAGGMIGTEINVPVVVAYEAAEEFFYHFGSGETIGHSMLAMRWQLLNKGSFLGLAYTPYAMADLHLEKTKKS